MTAPDFFFVLVLLFYAVKLVILSVQIKDVSVFEFNVLRDWFFQRE